MSTHAIAIVHEEAGVYGIAFPDLPGCIAAGDSLDEVLQRGAAAAAAYIDSLIEDGEPIPMLRTLDQLKADPLFRNEAEDGMIVGLPIDLPGKAVRVKISLDQNLVAAVDRAAERAGLSRSAFLAAAAKAKLGG
jgi:predicted RNase H-like HicB family nuclease